MSFNDQLQRLQAFLDADDLHDEALDYMAACGYLSALAISPEPVADEELLAELFAETPPYESPAQQDEIIGTLLELKARIARELASDEDLELPCELTLGDEPDYSDLRNWCIGFMEGFSCVRRPGSAMTKSWSASCCCRSWSAPACLPINPSSPRSSRTKTWSRIWSSTFRRYSPSFSCCSTPRKKSLVQPC